MPCPVPSRGINGIHEVDAPDIIDFDSPEAADRSVRNPGNIHYRSRRQGKHEGRPRAGEKPDGPELLQCFVSVPCGDLPEFLSSHRARRRASRGVTPADAGTGATGRRESHLDEQDQGRKPQASVRVGCGEYHVRSLRGGGTLLRTPEREHVSVPPPPPAWDASVTNTASPAHTDRRNPVRYTRGSAKPAACSLPRHAHLSCSTGCYSRPARGTESTCTRPLHAVARTR